MNVLPVNQQLSLPTSFTNTLPSPVPDTQTLLRSLYSFLTQPPPATTQASAPLPMVPTTLLSTPTTPVSLPATQTVPTQTGKKETKKKKTVSLYFNTIIFLMQEPEEESDDEGAGKYDLEAYRRSNREMMFLIPQGGQ